MKERFIIYVDFYLQHNIMQRKWNIIILYFHIFIHENMQTKSFQIYTIRI